MVNCIKLHVFFTHDYIFFSPHKRLYLCLGVQKNITGSNFWVEGIGFFSSLNQNNNHRYLQAYACGEGQLVLSSKHVQLSYDATRAAI